MLITASAYLIFLYYSADAHRNWAENPNLQCVAVPMKNVGSCRETLGAMSTEAAGNGYSGAVRDALCVEALPEVCVPTELP